ncbi:ABC transporter permease [Micromonospora marina]|uniref:ABC transporter permease n=1 Tax=Micromonospora marina TaxID=307120 RepID=UPI0034534666
MIRVLRTQLRRSAAPGAALVVLMAGIVLLYLERYSWTVGWMPLALAQRLSLVLVWPLAMAAGAWQARREHRSGIQELLESTARPRRQRVLPVLTALALAGGGAYVVTALAAAPMLIDPTSYLPAATVIVVAVGALAVATATWLGMALGRLLPSAVTAPALGVTGIGLLLTLLTVDADHRRLTGFFSPVIVQAGLTDFLTVPGRVSAAQTLWWLALGVTAMVLLAAGRTRNRVAALLPLALGATALTTMPQHGRHSVVAADPVAQQLVCATGSPRVCVSRMHAFLLPEVTPLARQGLTMLARLPAAPTEASEYLTSVSDPHPQRPETALFPVTFAADGSLQHADRFLLTMLRAGGAGPRFCPDDTDADSAADAATAYWLSGQAPTGEQEPVQHLWRVLDTLPEAEASGRVAALRDAARACSADRHALLTGGAA